MSGSAVIPPPIGSSMLSGATVDVLLIEDDEGDAVLVRELLSDVSDPIRLRWARSLAEAHDQLADADCVLLDLGLPDSIGLEGLRRVHADSARVPVVVLTGFEDEELGAGAVAAGAQDYLVKGRVTGHGLARTIRYAVQRRHVEIIESALFEERLHAAENLRLERGLLPRPLICTADVGVATRYQAGGGRMLLGGDFFDVVENKDGSIQAIVGDVAGHGPDQAALGVALRIAWRTLVLAGHPTTDILPVLDRMLIHERHDDVLFATVCTVRIAADRRTMSIAVAGHPPLAVLGDGIWAITKVPAGPALGLIDGATWEATDVTLPVGPWQLLLYTDGVIEGHCGSGAERLGVDGFVRLLQQRLAIAADPEPASLLDALIARVTALNEGPLTDDLALLMLVHSPREPE